MLPNNRKNYLYIQRPLIFMCQRYGYQTFELFDLNENFRKFT